MQLNLKYVWVAAVSFLLLAGCESRVREPTDIQQELSLAGQQAQQQKKNAQVPAQVLQELMPVSVLPSPQIEETRFDIAADHIDAATFFASLVDGTSYSVAVHPDVSAEITLNLNQVTLDEALHVVKSIYGFDVQKIGNIYQIYPAVLRTQTFSINYLMLTRLGRSRTTINSSSLVDGERGSDNDDSTNSNSNDSGDVDDSSSSNTAGTVIETSSASDFWLELQGAVQLIVGRGEGRAVITTPQSGLLTVRAMPSELASVETFIRRLQNRVQRQVLLEAKILEVRLSDGFQQGIDWNALANGTSGFYGGMVGSVNTSSGNVNSRNMISGNEISQLVGGVFSLGYQSPDFTAVINLLKTQGNVNVLSSPRISAANNQKAVIKVGTDEYFVTGVSTTTTTGNTTTNTPEVELSPFFEGIALDVTPQIDDLGAVLLHVHPSVTDIQEQTKVINLFGDQFSLPLALSDIRETDTIVRANSGDVVVIGGLMNTTRRQNNSKLPILGDIPLVGGLFTNTAEMEEKHELVILIRPTIVESSHGQPLLEQASDNLDSWYRRAGKRSLLNR